MKFYSIISSIVVPGRIKQVFGTRTRTRTPPIICLNVSQEASWQRLTVFGHLQASGILLVLMTQFLLNRVVSRLWTSRHQTSPHLIVLVQNRMDLIGGDVRLSQGNLVEVA